jgi:hypothetical protein
MALCSTLLVSGSAMAPPNRRDNGVQDAAQGAPISRSRAITRTRACDRRALFASARARIGYRAPFSVQEVVQVVTLPWSHLMQALTH